MGIYTNLVLDEWIERAFYHALRTNGFVILAGLTGTGKTRLFKEFRVGNETLACLCILLKRTKLLDKIEAFRKWVINQKGRWSLQSMEVYSNQFNPNSLLSRLQEEDWIKELLNKENKAFKLENFGFRSDMDKSSNFLLYEKLASNYRSSYYIAQNREPKQNRGDGDFKGDMYFVNNPNDFFNNEVKPILDELSDMMKRGDSSGIENDPGLKRFFSKEVVDFFAFVANPFRSTDFSEKIRKNLCELCEQCLECSVLKKCFFPIRPDFTDPSYLVGYFNPIDKKYCSTEIVKFILKAIPEYLKCGKAAAPYLILFDEMNIAQVEYYFADFLSVLESPRIEEPGEHKDKIQEFMRTLKSFNIKCDDDLKKFRGFTSEGITLEPGTRKILLPPNLYFVGTVNMDETTRSFSPKVLDRAFVIEFDSDLRQFIEGYEKRVQLSCRLAKCDFTRGGDFYLPDRKRIAKFIAGLNNNHVIFRIYKVLKEYNLHFGYRTVEHIAMFIVNSQDTCHNELRMSGTEAVDVAIYTKILPKLWGPRAKLEQPLKKLLKELCKNVTRKNGQQPSKGQFNFEGGTLKWKKSESGGDAGKEEEEVVIENVARIVDKKVKIENAVNDACYEIETDYPLTVRKILEMLYRLEVEGFCSFM